MTWGDKFTDTEVDDAFAEFVIEDGQIDAAHLKSLMVAKKEEEERRDSTTRSNHDSQIRAWSPSGHPPPGGRV